MAEAIAFGASVLAFIDITFKVTLACQTYITAVRDAPKELKLILIETSSLKATLESIQFLLTTSDDHVPEEQNLATQIGEPINACKTCVLELLGFFPAHINPREGPRKLLDALAWPFRKPRAMALLEQISRHRESIHLGLSTEMSKDIREIKSDLRAVSAKLTEAERDRLYKWLEKANPSRNHNDACALHEDHTGKWMLRSKEWQDWLAGSSQSRLFWVHGIPGAGKTVLASFLIDEIRDLCRGANGRGSAYYYCYFARSCDESVPFLTWVLGQLCRQTSDDIPSALHDLYRAGCDPKISELLDALEAVLTRFTIAFVAIDTVDESLPRDNLLELLSQLTTDTRFSKLRLLVTSREYQDIFDCLESLTTPISMSNPYVEDDIATYVKSVLRGDKRFRRWPHDLKNELVAELPKRAKGMFRWAICQFDILRRCKTPNEIQSAIANLPETLDETYERIFQSIHEKDRTLVRRTLALIWGEANINDLGDGLMPWELLPAVLQGEDVSFHDGFFTFDTLWDICGCLIKVSSRAHEVRLAHYTVQEYLSSERVLCSRVESVRLFALNSKDASQIYLTAVLSAATQIADLDTGNGSNPHAKAIDNNFKEFVLIATMDALSGHANLEVLFDSGPMEKLLFQVLHPLGTCSRWLIEFCYSESYDHAITQGTFRTFAQNWKVIHVEVARSTIEADAALLSAVIGMNSVPLLREYLRGKSPNDLNALLHANLYVELSRRNAASVPGVLERPQRLVGTIIGLLYHLLESGEPVGQALEWLLAIPGGGHPESEDLIAQIAIHNPDIEPDAGLSHEHEYGTCQVTQLLNKGTSPGADGRQVTPLQVAVATGNATIVEQLLNAGADPNEIGCVSGGPPPRGVLFTILRWGSPNQNPVWAGTMSPLLIALMRKSRVGNSCLSGAREEVRFARICEVLVQFGARDFDGEVKNGG
ncbi:hypothetical protein B0T19DRAFT_413912 [Cercophora scortea]|uniref:NACHT domain-containing protein n=1 Tax=Cercophora scortea TaxID=314031 RepID=A0AAE0IVD1_9PEZI|nr:hypothetical protein B0T19DRAFT_413912 [Cercophora scortea]